MNEKDQLERQVSETLTEGEMETEHPDAAARDRLRTRYEIRIQASTDPIVAETNKYRSMAEEVDDRYEAYMQRAERRKQND